MTEVSEQQTNFVNEMTKIIESCIETITSQRTKHMVEAHKHQLQQQMKQQQQNKVELVLVKEHIYHNDQEILNDRQTQMQKIRDEQEEILGDMLSVLKVLGVQGHAITGELQEQNEMLKEIGGEMDNVQGRITQLAHKLDALIGHSESKKYCIIIVLVVVLMVMIYFMI